MTNTQKRRLLHIGALVKARSGYRISSDPLPQEYLKVVYISCFSNLIKVKVPRDYNCCSIIFEGEVINTICVLLEDITSIKGYSSTRKELLNE